MKAMILAAGRGERLRPITDVIPKPLVKVGSFPLIVHHIKKLSGAGIRDIVINTAWLGHCLTEELGDGSSFGVSISWSHEIPGGLETAGGIRHALPLLGDSPFLVINGDTYIDGDFRQFMDKDLGSRAAHLWLTENPSHHPQGDFSLEGNLVRSEPCFTFSGAALYNPEYIQPLPDERKPLKPVLLSWMEKNLVTGELLSGKWFDVGSAERLQETRNYVLETEKQRK